MKNNKQETITCTDKKCPFHGKVKTHGRKIKGIVIGKDLHGTAKVEWIRKVKIPKYERFEIRRSRVKAHNPACINAEKGDIVIIQETRPLSKTKHFVIIKKIGKYELFKQREELLEEGKFKKSKKEIVNEMKEQEKTEETEKENEGS